MHGTLALVGSGEYRPPMELVDRWLLESAPGTPRVICLPTAAGAEGDVSVSYWMNKGVRHFQRMGVQTEALPVIDRGTAENPEYGERIRNANFVYLSGGNPIYLYDTLVGTASWEAIREVLNGGGVVVGCSAGAMIFGRHAVPWGLHPGFNLLPGSDILPHYDELPHCDEFPVRSAGVLKVWLARRTRLVGIEGYTALVIRQLDEAGLSAVSSPWTDASAGRPIGEQSGSRTLGLQVIGARGVTIWGSSRPVRYCTGQKLLWS